MIGVVLCCWTSTYPVCHAHHVLKPVKKAISAEKNISGRQLARVSCIKYHETVWSELYPGNRHTVQCFQPAVLATENALELVLSNASARFGAWTTEPEATNNCFGCWAEAIKR